MTSFSSSSASSSSSSSSTGVVISAVVIDPYIVDVELGGLWFYIVHFSALTGILLSIIGATYVLLTTWCARRRGREVVNSANDITLRLPIYLAGLDLLFALVHSSDHLYMVLFLYPPPPLICKGMGIALVVCLSTQVIMLTIIAVVTYLRICHQIDVSFGKHDWKLILICLIFPLAESGVAIYFDALGPSKYWCYLRYHDSMGFILYWANAATLGLAFIIIVVSYRRVVVKVRSISMSFAQVSPPKKIANRRASSSIMPQPSQIPTQIHSPANQPPPGFNQAIGGGGGGIMNGSGGNMMMGNGMMTPNYGYSNGNGNMYPNGMMNNNHNTNHGNGNHTNAHTNNGANGGMVKMTPQGSLYGNTGVMQPSSHQYQNNAPSPLPPPQQMNGDRGSPHVPLYINVSKAPRPSTPVHVVPISPVNHNHGALALPNGAFTNGNYSQNGSSRGSLTYQGGGGINGMMMGNMGMNSGSNLPPSMPPSPSPQPGTPTHGGHGLTLAANNRRQSLALPDGYPTMGGGSPAGSGARGHRRSTSKADNALSTKNNSMAKNVTSKVMRFQVAFMAQWIGYIVCLVLLLVNIEYPFVYAIALGFFNAGGFFNSLAYGRNRRAPTKADGPSITEQQQALKRGFQRPSRIIDSANGNGAGSNNSPIAGRSPSPAHAAQLQAFARNGYMNGNGGHRRSSSVPTQPSPRVGGTMTPPPGGNGYGSPSPLPPGAGGNGIAPYYQQQSGGGGPHVFTNNNGYMQQQPHAQPYHPHHGRGSSTGHQALHLPMSIPMSPLSGTLSGLDMPTAPSSPSPLPPGSSGGYRQQQTLTSAMMMVMDRKQHHTNTDTATPEGSTNGGDDDTASSLPGTLTPPMMTGHSIATTVSGASTNSHALTYTTSGVSNNGMHTNITNDNHRESTSRDTANNNNNNNNNNPLDANGVVGGNLLAMLSGGTDVLGRDPDQMDRHSIRNREHRERAREQRERERHTNNNTIATTGGNSGNSSGSNDHRSSKEKALANAAAQNHMIELQRRSSKEHALAVAFNREGNGSLNGSSGSMHTSGARTPRNSITIGGPTNSSGTTTNNTNHNSNNPTNGTTATNNHTQTTGIALVNIPVIENNGSGNAVSSGLLSARNRGSGSGGGLILIPGVSESVLKETPSATTGATAPPPQAPPPSTVLPALESATNDDHHAITNSVIAPHHMRNGSNPLGLHSTLGALHSIHHPNNNSSSMDYGSMRHTPSPSAMNSSGVHSHFGAPPGSSGGLRGDSRSGSRQGHMRYASSRHPLPPLPPTSAHSHRYPRGHSSGSSLGGNNTQDTAAFNATAYAATMAANGLELASPAAPHLRSFVMMGSPPTDISPSPLSPSIASAMSAPSPDPS